MKKSLALLVVFAMAFSVIGCSSGGTSGGDSSGDSSGSDSEQEKTLETEEMTYQYSNMYSVDFDVIADRGFVLEEEFEPMEEVGKEPSYPNVLLHNDRVRIYFKTESYVYHTSVYYDPTHELYKGEHPEYSEDDYVPNFADMTEDVEDDRKFEIDGKSATGRVLEYGPSSDYETIGYHYNIDMGDVYFYLTIDIIAADDSVDAENILDDEEVKAIMDSIKINTLYEG